MLNLSTKPTDLYIGVMSGTSMDAIDAVAARFNLDGHIELVAQISEPIESPVRQQIQQLCQPGSNEIDAMGSLDTQLGDIYASVINQLIEQHSLKRCDIAAIGLHGQTIRHRPNLSAGAFTLQIGDANRVAENTGITTIADFRRRDMAAGGQGAPLAPAFHQALFAKPASNRAILNVGGMANITLLPADPTKAVYGYDTGPGNVLSDAWIKHRQNKPFDKDGQLAASGQVNRALLEQLYSLDYFSQPFPKSTGREQFHLSWIQQALDLQGEPLADEDVQATVLELTALSVADAVRHADLEELELYVCGGGAYNLQLLTRLRALLPQLTKITSTAALGMDPDWVEAAAFAWLAKQTIEGKPGNLAAVTGASGARILGAIYPA